MLASGNYESQSVFSWLEIVEGLGMRLKSSSNLTSCRLLPHSFIYSKMSSLYCYNAMYFTFLHFVILNALLSQRMITSLHTLYSLLVAMHLVSANHKLAYK